MTVEMAITRKHIKQTDLKDVLASAEKELQETLAEAERLKEFITATRKLVGRRRAASASLSGGLILKRKRRANAMADQVVQILKDTKKPMHAQDIVTQLVERGYQFKTDKPSASVAVALARRSDQFEKVGPNTFDLVNKENVAVSG